MRVGQLARKLNIKPKQVQEFLNNEHNVMLEDGPNVKIDDEHVELVMAQFEPKPEDSEDPSDLTPPVSQEETQPSIETEESIPPAESPDNNNHPLVDEVASPPVPEEIIKAPKVKLEGFKVVDKIELPELAPEQIEVDGVLMDKAEYKKKKEEEKKAKEEAKAKRRTKKRAQKKPKQTTDESFSFEKNEKAEREKLEKQAKEDAKRRKEEQKKHYQELHAVKTVHKKKKRKVKATHTVATKEVENTEVSNANETQNAVDSETRPSTNEGALKRFWKWLNT